MTDDCPLYDLLIVLPFGFLREFFQRKRFMAGNVKMSKAHATISGMSK
jgi:hypothetical protein